jgi:hypothetical protein
VFKLLTSGWHSLQALTLTMRRAHDVRYCLHPSFPFGIENPGPQWEACTAESQVCYLTRSSTSAFCSYPATGFDSIQGTFPKFKTLQDCCKFNF